MYFFPPFTTAYDVLNPVSTCRNEIATKYSLQSKFLRAVKFQSSGMYKNITWHVSFQGTTSNLRENDQYE